MFSYKLFKQKASRPMRINGKFKIQIQMISERFYLPCRSGMSNIFVRFFRINFKEGVKRGKIKEVRGNEIQRE